MAWRFVKQPNGLYARFSEVVDDFTNCNLTRDEAIYEAINWHGCSQDIAISKVNNADADNKRFDEAMEIIRRVHGDEVYQKWARQLIAEREDA